MKTWQIIAATVLSGLAVGYVLAKASVAYVSQGTPMPYAVGTDPTLNFTGGPATGVS